MQRLQPQLKGSVKELNKFHNHETKKITRKASDVAEYIELFGSFTRDRHADASSCMTILGGRTEQLDCRFSATSLAL